MRIAKKFLSTHPEFEGKSWYYESNQLLERDIEAVQEELVLAAKTQWRNDCVSIGLGWAAWKQAEKIGLLNDVEDVFGRDNVRYLLALAIYQLDSGGAMINFEDWLSMNWLPHVQPLTSQRISELLAEVSQNKIDSYYSKRWNFTQNGTALLTTWDMHFLIKWDSVSLIHNQLGLDALVDCFKN